MIVFQDELQIVVEAARQMHDSNNPRLLGTLVRAVELLAYRQDERTNDGNDDVVEGAKNKSRILWLETEVKRLEREQRQCLSALSESGFVHPNRTMLEAINDLVKLHGKAANRIAELEREVTRQQGVIRLQNKTMEDHVSRGVHESILRAKVDGLEKRIAELTAPVIVDADKIHTPTLEFVRRQIDNLDGHGEPDDSREVGGPWIHKKDALRVIDEIFVANSRQK